MPCDPQAMHPGIIMISREGFYKQVRGDKQVGDIKGMFKK
jgi:hypothetical protein